MRGGGTRPVVEYCGCVRTLMYSPRSVVWRRRVAGSERGPGKGKGCLFFWFREFQKFFLRFSRYPIL